MVQERREAVGRLVLSLGAAVAGAILFLAYFKNARAYLWNLLDWATRRLLTWIGVDPSTVSQVSGASSIILLFVFLTMVTYAFVQRDERK